MRSTSIILVDCLFGVLLVATQVGALQAWRPLQEMRQHMSNAWVQEQGCRGLTTLAGANAQHRIKIKELGGIDDILEAMRQHRSHAGVQEQCCTALRNLALKNNDNKINITEAGGIAIIQEAMRQHLSNARVQEQGCGALRSLGGNYGNRIKIKEAGGVDVILEAMRQHRSHAGVQEQGCTALRILRFGGNMCACPQNTFAGKSGSCEPCGVGSWSDEGSTACSCNKGWTAAGGTGGSMCAKCPANTFKAVRGPSGCKACPTGSVSPEGSEAVLQCVPCPAGTFAGKSGSCEPCGVLRKRCRCCRCWGAKLL